MSVVKFFQSIIKIVYPRMVRVTINGERVRAMRSVTIENDPEDNIQLKDIFIENFTNHAYQGEFRKGRRERKRDLARLFESWERSREEDLFCLRRLFRCEEDFAPATGEQRTFWEEEAARYRRGRRAGAKRRLILELDEEEKEILEEEAARARRGRRADAERRLRLRLEEEAKKFWEEEAARAHRERRADADYRLGLEEEIEVIVLEDEEDEEEDMDWVPEEEEEDDL